MDREDLSESELQQISALYEISDEVMSILHAPSLKEETIPSSKVVQWLRGIYDSAQVGLGKPSHFTKSDGQAS